MMYVCSFSLEIYIQSYTILPLACSPEDIVKFTFVVVVAIINYIADMLSLL
jgi:hypothetical protein